MATEARTFEVLGPPPQPAHIPGTSHKPSVPMEHREAHLLSRLHKNRTSQPTAQLFEAGVGSQVRVVPRPGLIRDSTVAHEPGRGARPRGCKCVQLTSVHAALCKLATESDDGPIARLGWSELISIGHRASAQGGVPKQGRGVGGGVTRPKASHLRPRRQARAATALLTG